MSLENVQQALISAFTGASIVDADKIAWENVKFTPPVSAPWAAVYFMPAMEKVATLGAGGTDQADGLFQVTYYIPVGGGEGDSRAKMNSLRTAFTPGQITYNGQPVTILGRYKGPGLTFNNFYAIPFTVRWRAFLTRS